MRTLTVFVCLVLLSCKPATEKLSTVDRVLQVIQRDYGAFDEESYSKDSLSSFHTYNKGDVTGNTNKIKNLIDKTVNVVGTEYKGKSGANLGEWTWESPTEKITLGAGMKASEGTSYINLWIDRK